MKRNLIFGAISALVGLICWSAVAHPWGWLYGFGVHPYPASSSTPWTYQLLSGFVPALTVLGLLTFISGAWHRVNCHTDKCLRVGRFPIAGGQFSVCTKHHRQVTGHPAKLTVEVLKDLHLAHHHPATASCDPDVQQA